MELDEDLTIDNAYLYRGAKVMNFKSLLPLDPGETLGEGRRGGGGGGRGGVSSGVVGFP